MISRVTVTLTVVRGSTSLLIDTELSGSQNCSNLQAGFIGTIPFLRIRLASLQISATP